MLDCCECGDDIDSCIADKDCLGYGRRLREDKDVEIARLSTALEKLIAAAGSLEGVPLAEAIATAREAVEKSRLPT